MKLLYIARGLLNPSPNYEFIKNMMNHVDGFAVNIHDRGRCEVGDKFVINSLYRRFPKFEFLKYGSYKRALNRGARTLPKDWSPDLIHANFGYPQGALARDLSLRMNVPYVVSLRGSDINLFPKNSGYIAKSLSSALRNASAVVGVSQAILTRAAEIGASPDRCHHLPDGIFTEIFTPTETPKNAKDKTIVFVGSLRPVKNIERMMAAFFQAKKTAPDIKLKIIGTGSELTAINSAIKKNPRAADDVSLLGRLKPEEVAEEMRRSSLLFLPSISEGWPNVVMEALACGIPVVASNVGGIPDQINSNDIGLLCDPLSVEDMSRKLITALNKDWDQEVLSRRGRMYSKENIAEKVFEIYRKIIPSA